MGSLFNVATEMGINMTIFLRGRRKETIVGIWNYIRRVWKWNFRGRKKLTLSKADGLSSLYYFSFFYLKDLVSQKAYLTNDTRFHLPTVELDVFKMSFSFHGLKTWNDLPYHLCNICSFTGSKCLLFDCVFHP